MLPIHWTKQARSSRRLSLTKMWFVPLKRDGNAFQSVLPLQGLEYNCKNHSTNLMKMKRREN